MMRSECCDLRPRRSVIRMTSKCVAFRIAPSHVQDVAASTAHDAGDTRGPTGQGVQGLCL